MVKEVKYTSINRVLDNLMDHPMLSDVSLEQVVRYTIRFIAKNGFSKFYQNKIEDLEIQDFRAALPCDLISINQVKDLKTGICLRAMTDIFPKGIEPTVGRKCKDPMNNARHTPYIQPKDNQYEEPSFKTQGNVIYTSFPEGMVQISYKAIAVDENGFPMLIDNEVYLDALEAYIKKQIFTIKFDQGKITAGVLQNAQQEYAVAAKLLQSEFTTPSVSEMEAIARMWNTMIPRMREFDNGFSSLGNREWIKKH